MCWRGKLLIDAINWTSEKRSMQCMDLFNTHIKHLTRDFKVSSLYLCTVLITYMWVVTNTNGCYCVCFSPYTFIFKLLKEIEENFAHILLLYIHPLCAWFVLLINETMNIIIESVSDHLEIGNDSVMENIIINRGPYWYFVRTDTEIRAMFMSR